MQLIDSSCVILLLVLCSVTLPLNADNSTDAVTSLQAYAKFKSGDYEQARAIWQQLADKGNTTALINLANLFQQGMGVSKDQRQALHYIRQAAELGDARAQYELGMEFEKGQLVERDLQQASRWLHKSAQQDNADGQFAYGIMLATAFGKGLDQATRAQRKAARYWLMKAQSNGHPDARPYIELLETTK